MNDEIRIKYAYERYLSKSIATISIDDWGQMVRNDGTLTVLEQVPTPLSNVTIQATVVAAVASGMSVEEPGIDIVRYDPNDDPYNYNIDHYSVVETFTRQECYTDVLQAAGVEDSPSLQEELASHVYIIKDNANDNHWVEEIPNDIKEAKEKHEE